MDTDIETLDQRRMRYLALYLVGFVFFMILWLMRYFFRLSSLNTQPIGTAVFIGLLISLLVLVISTIGSVTLGRKIKQDPRLSEALYNELVQSIETQSWKAAYLGAIGASCFFAVTWFFYPLCDPVMVALTSIIAGFGAYQATFYFKYRSA